MSKRKPKPKLKRKVRRQPTPKIVKVELPKAGIVRVIAPPGVVPVVIPSKSAVEIIPIKPPPKKAQTWWESFLYGSND